LPDQATAAAWYRPDLEIMSLRRNEKFELDVILRNIGNEPVVIHAIEIMIIRDFKCIVMSAIEPSAKYDIPVDKLKLGERRKINISHCVPAHDVDRFQIDLHTRRMFAYRLTVYYNKNKVIYAETHTPDELRAQTISESTQLNESKIADTPTESSQSTPVISVQPEHQSFKHFRLIVITLNIFISLMVFLAYILPSLHLRLLK